MYSRAEIRKPSTEIEWLRAAAARRVQESSLREVARSVGVSPTGLQKFLDGARPHEKTLVKLRTWFVREGAQSAHAVRVEDAHSALLVLTHGLTNAERQRVVNSALSHLASAYREPPPAWLDQMQQLWMGDD